MLKHMYMKALQYRAFWRLRATLGRAVFAVAATGYRLRAWNRSSADRNNTFREFVDLTQYSVLRGVGAGISLQIVGYILAIRFPWLNLPEDKHDTYAGLLFCVAGICGVFIALYYTAIATVGASIYAVIPNDIRDLLHRDRAGNVYLRFLSFLTFLCLFLVTLHLWGLGASWLALSAVCLLSGFGIFAFVILGRHAFNLFNPIKLSGTVFHEMRKYVQAATPAGYRWLDPSFQTPARQGMERQLRVLGTLADYVAEKEHLRVASYPELAAHTVTFLSMYQLAKRTIPADSAWYEPRPIYQDWYRANYNAVKVATVTGTTIRSDEDRDPLWVERRLLPILYSYIRCAVREGSLESVGLMGGFVQDYVHLLFSDGEVARGATVLSEIGETVFKAIREIPAIEAAKAETTVKVIGATELLAALSVQGIVKYREALPAFGRAAIRRQLAAIRWTKRASIYHANLPARLLKQVEWAAPRLSFERAVYGSIITPDWYILDVVMAKESVQLDDNVRALVHTIPGLHKAWKGLAKMLSVPWPYMVILSREWEYAHKLRDFLGVFKTHCKQDVSARISDSLKWRDVNFDALERTRLEHWNDIQAEMATSAEEYSPIERPDSYPDCVGQFMHATADGILDSLVANDVAHLKKLFPRYREACLSRYVQFIPDDASDVQAWNNEIMAAGGIILDLLDLSGYAKLFAEYHGNPELWQVVTVDWDTYFDAKTGEPRVRHIATLLETVDNPTQLTHRGILRTNWEIGVRQFLKQLPRHYESKAADGSFMPPDEVVGHASPMIRLFAKDAYGLSLDGIDIFAAYYLSPRLEAVGSELPSKYGDLKDMVDREAETPGQGRRGPQRYGRKEPT